MIDGAKGAMAKKMLGSLTPSEMPQAKALAKVVAALESEQADALDRLTDVAGIDADVAIDEDQRRDQILDIVDALAEGELARYYLVEEADIDKPERAAHYAGISADEWAEQKRQWFREYRERGVVDTPLEEASEAAVDQVAATHVETIFGVSLGEFVDGIVEFREGMAVEVLLAGPLQGHTELINQVADELEDES